MAIEDRIYIGAPGSYAPFAFDQNSIESVFCNNEVGLIGNELVTDILEASVFYNDVDGELLSVAYGTPVYYYNGIKLVGKFYVLKIERTGYAKYLIRATSKIGIVSKEMFYGGMYSGEKVSTIAREIMCDTGLGGRYKVYSACHTVDKTWPQNGAVLLSDDGYGEASWDSSMYAEFSLGSVQNASYTNRDNVVMGYEARYGEAGYPDRYYVGLRQMTESGDTVSYYYPILGYGRTLFVFNDTTIKIGKGSRFSFDIRPSEGIASVDVQYVDYHDPSTTGTIHLEKIIESVYESVNRPKLYCAFGSSTEVSSTLAYSTEYYKYVIKSTRGDVLINAVPAYDTAENRLYIGNTISGYSNAVQTYTEYGETSYKLLINEADYQYSVGSIQAIERNKEFDDTVVFENGCGDIRVWGWIPYGTRREALHQLIFSQNINLIRGNNGELLFTTLSASGATPLVDDDPYDKGSEQYETRAKIIEVTEHNYIDGQSSEVIFDNTDSEAIQGSYIAKFKNAPVSGTPVGSGITILAHNCNLALVTGRGQISGTPYLHTQNSLKYEDTEVVDGNDVSVTDVTLITSVNADSVMEKLKAYYCHEIMKISNSFRFNGESCGVVYSFTGPFMEEITAFLVKRRLQSSSFVKASCEFVSGYVPPRGGGYTDFAIITYGQSFTIPQSVRDRADATLRLVVIGAGTSGQSGSNGQAGGTGSYGTDVKGGTGGEGGKGGAKGIGGKILSATLMAAQINRVTAERSSTNTIAKTLNDSSTVTHTYNSTNGVRNANGYTNIFTGVVYALDGVDGTDGGKGGDGGAGYVKEIAGGIEYVTDPGTNGESVNGNLGGIGSYGYRTYSETYEYLYGGNGGGGASYNYNGENGGAPANGQNYGGKGADGGPAATAVTTYGCGGNGGNGGAGGGGGNVYARWWYNQGNDYYLGTGGSGGLGGSGTNGIDGCVIIYY